MSAPSDNSLQTADQRVSYGIAMNMGANLGGAISPTLTPWVAHQWGWGTSLGLAAFIALIGGLLWFRIKPGDGLKHC